MTLVQPDTATVERVIHHYSPHGAARELFNSQDREICLSGPAGCVAGDTKLFDPITGDEPTFRWLTENRVRPWVQTLHGPVLADVPFMKGTAELFRVELTNGHYADATADHLFLSDRRWAYTGSLAPGSLLLSSSLEDVHRWKQTTEDCRDDCCRYPHQYGAPPRQVSKVCLNRSELVPVKQITSLGVHDFYDLHVPGEEHYWAQGMWHHNTGKSLACLQKIFYISMLNPNVRSLLVRKTQSSLSSTGLVTWREKVIANAKKEKLVRYYGGSSVEPPQYIFHNESRVMLSGMDRSEKIMSSEFDLIFVQEAIELRLEDWEKLLTRLRNNQLSFHQLMADTNPDSSSHWLRLRAKNGPLRMLNSLHKDNPMFWDQQLDTWTPAGLDYVRSTLDTLTGQRKERLRYGRWVASEGAIFKEFNYDTHVIDSFPIPDSWDRYVSIDFGFTNPTVIQWWAVDDDGRLYMYREIYRTQTLVEDHAKTVKKLMYDDAGKLVEPWPKRWLADHDAEGRATFNKHVGASTTAANKRVLQGIEHVSERLRVREDGKPRIFWFRDALVEKDGLLEKEGKPVSTIQEIDKYVWDKNQTEKGEDRPKKEDDHGCLVAGTMVATSEGDVAIENVRPGMRVWTRQGLKRVLFSGCTDLAAETFDVELSNGGVLSGTGDHPVWVEDVGWTRLDALRYGVKLNSTSIPDRSIVVEGVRGGLVRPVFNLKVEDCPEFYANEVLVHNCDAVRYVVMFLDYKKSGRVRSMRTSR